MSSQAMLAGRWTLLDRSGEPLRDECAARGVAAAAPAPYSSGLLAQAEPPDDAGDGQQFR